MRAYVTELETGPYWENIGQVLSCTFMHRAAGEVHKLTKKNETNIFPVRAEQFSSLRVFNIMALFRNSWEHSTFYWRNARTTIRQEKLFLSYHFLWSSAKIFGQTTRKRILLNVKVFPLENLHIINLSYDPYGPARFPWKITKLQKKIPVRGPCAWASRPGKSRTTRLEMHTTQRDAIW